MNYLIIYIIISGFISMQIVNSFYKYVPIKKRLNDLIFAFFIGSFYLPCCIFIKIIRYFQI